MNAPQAPGGCGSGACGCASGARQAQDAVPAINGIALAEMDAALSAEELRERAWGELMRQEAVRQGVLPRRPVLVAPVLDTRDHDAIQSLLDAAVPLAEPSDAECRRYYDANTSRYVEGRRARVRHILFAVTDGLDVEALAVRAEQALLELTSPEVAAHRFGELAHELSNCPSGAEGGDLGWIGPEDLAEELARELFHRKDAPQATELVPRLVHSRFGLHVIEVLEREPGRQLTYEQVRERIGTQLAQRSRATALHQYIRVLAGAALVEGIDLEGAASPLVQ